MGAKSPSPALTSPGFASYSQTKIVKKSLSILGIAKISSLSFTCSCQSPPVPRVAMRGPAAG